MKREVKKKMTIDTLAAMVAKGFEEVARSAARLENNLIYHIGNVKDQLAGTDKRIDDFAETKVAKVTYKELSNHTKNTPLARGVFCICPAYFRRGELSFVLFRSYPVYVILILCLMQS